VLHELFSRHHPLYPLRDKYIVTLRLPLILWLESFTKMFLTKSGYFAFALQAMLLQKHCDTKALWFSGILRKSVFSLPEISAGNTGYPFDNR